MVSYVPWNTIDLITTHTQISWVVQGTGTSLLSDYLGNLTSEHITEFALSGSKSYGYLQCVQKLKAILWLQQAANTNSEMLRDLILIYKINPDTDVPEKIRAEQCSVARTKRRAWQKQGPFRSGGDALWHKHLNSQFWTTGQLTTVRNIPLLCYSDKAQQLLEKSQEVMVDA